MLVSGRDKPGNDLNIADSTINQYMWVHVSNVYNTKSTGHSLNDLYGDLNHILKITTWLITLFKDKS